MTSIHESDIVVIHYNTVSGRMTTLKDGLKVIKALIDRYKHRRGTHMLADNRVRIHSSMRYDSLYDGIEYTIKAYVGDAPFRKRVITLRQGAMEPPPGYTGYTYEVASKDATPWEELRVAILHGDYSVSGELSLCNEGELSIEG